MDEHMLVYLLAATGDPEMVCEFAAAVCVGAKPDLTGYRHLKAALASGHDAVLEHACFTFRVAGVSRVLLAQLTRHRLASFAVRSQRYVSHEKEMEAVMPPKVDALGAQARDAYRAQMAQMHAWYADWKRQLGGSGNEDARFVLPGACGTSLLLTMNARELLHFFALRCCTRAQWEIRQLADEMLRACKRHAPLLFENAGASCVRLGYCPEARSCGKAPKLEALQRAYDAQKHRKGGEDGHEHA